MYKRLYYEYQSIIMFGIPRFATPNPRLSKDFKNETNFIPIVFPIAPSNYITIYSGLFFTGCHKNDTTSTE